MKPEPHLHDMIEDRARTDSTGRWAIAYALLQLAVAQKSTAFHLKYLGNGDAATPMGAIEMFGKHIGEKLDALTEAQNGIAESLADLASAREPKP